MMWKVRELSTNVWHKNGPVVSKMVTPVSKTNHVMETFYCRRWGQARVHFRQNLVFHKVPSIDTVLCTNAEIQNSLKYLKKSLWLNLVTENFLLRHLIFTHSKLIQALLLCYTMNLVLTWNDNSARWILKDFHFFCDVTGNIWQSIFIG